jgi:hypothetical protein
VRWTRIKKATPTVAASKPFELIWLSHYRLNIVAERGLCGSLPLMLTVDTSMSLLYGVVRVVTTDESVHM